MRNPDHLVLGKKGEKLARLYLLDHDYIILERNFFFGNLEVDIIAEKDNEIVFVEVKTWKRRGIEGPESAVDSNKEKNLMAASEAYMTLHELDLDYRIDIISIVLNDTEFTINHFENAGQFFLLEEY